MLAKTTKIINSLIKYISLFCVSFIWLNFYFRNYKTSALLAIIISLVIGVLLKLLTDKKIANTTKKTKTMNQIKNISNQLLFSSEKEIFDYFSALLKLKFEDITPVQKKFFKSIEKNTGFIPCYNEFTITADNILQIFLLLKNQNLKIIYVCCVSYTSEALALASQIKEFEMVLLNENDIYIKLMQPLNKYPKTSITFKTNKKLQTKEYLYLAFNKKQSSKYFFGGVITLFFSLFTFFKIYYLVMSTILFVFAIYSRYNQPFNPIITDF